MAFMVGSVHAIRDLSISLVVCIHLAGEMTFCAFWGARWLEKW
jgi:hypothetical protein